MFDVVLGPPTHGTKLVSWLSPGVLWWFFSGFPRWCPGGRGDIGVHWPHYSSL